MSSGSGAKFSEGELANFAWHCTYVSVPLILRQNFVLCCVVSVDLVYFSPLKCFEALRPAWSLFLSC